jgi:N-acetyltransferase
MRQAFNPQTTLNNSLVELRPLRRDDFHNLFEIASDPKLWEQHPAKERSQEEGFRKFFEEALQTRSAYAIVNKATQEIIGTSRYHPSSDCEKAIEIGWTFIARKLWGGHFNAAVKNLMLQHAFKHFEIVLFYIDKNNLRSQKAIEKIGGIKIESIYGIELTRRSPNNLIYAIDKNAFSVKDEK